MATLRSRGVRSYLKVEAGWGIWTVLLRLSVNILTCFWCTWRVCFRRKNWAPPYGCFWWVGAVAPALPPISTPQHVKVSYESYMWHKEGRPRCVHGALVCPSAYFYKDGKPGRGIGACLNASRCIELSLLLPSVDSRQYQLLEVRSTVFTARCTSA